MIQTVLSYFLLTYYPRGFQELKLLNMAILSLISMLFFFSDIDECVQNTHNCSKTSAFCNNTEGLFSCTCKPGFTGDGHNCTGTLVSRGRPFSGAYIVVTFQPSPQSFSALSNLDPTMRISEGFWGTREHWQNIEGNKGTVANFWEQGNKIRKITVQKRSENVWEHGNIGQFWKGTREQEPPPPPLL